MCLQCLQSVLLEKMGEADSQSSARLTWRLLVVLVWLVAIRGVGADTEGAGVASSRARVKGRTTKTALPGVKVRATKTVLPGARARALRMALEEAAEGKATTMLSTGRAARGQVRGAGVVVDSKLFHLEDTEAVATLPE